MFFNVFQREREKIEPKKTIENIKDFFFLRQNLARLTKKKRDRTQVNKIRNERWDIATDITEILKIIREYEEQSYASNYTM